MIPDHIIKQVGTLKEDLDADDLTSKGYIKKSKCVLLPFFDSETTKEISRLEDELQSEDITEKGFNKAVILLIDNFVSNANCEKDCGKKSQSAASKLVKFARSHNKENNQNLVNEVDGTNGMMCADEEAGSKDSKQNGNGDSEMDVTEECNGSDKSSSEAEISNKVDVSKPGTSQRDQTPDRKKVKGKRSQNKGGQPSIVDMFSASASKRKSEGGPREALSSAAEVAMEGSPSPEGKRLKRATEDSERKQDSIRMDNEVEVIKPMIEKCSICRQRLDSDELKIYAGHPEDANDEYIALTDPKLSLFSGEEESIHEYDERPQHKLTCFNVYDKAGHLCPFDGGLIERDVLIYFSGFLKPIYEEDPTVEGGIPAKDMGPINEWWIAGFDGGEKALIGFSTAYAEYILMDPSEQYASFLEAVQEKIYLSKLVIEVLLSDVEPAYEDLLNKIQLAVPPSGITAFSEDSLLRHAQFICDQVHNFEQAGGDQPEDTLITKPCMMNLVKLAGVTLGKRRAMRNTSKLKVVSKMPQFTKATTTPLVRDVFESIFSDQIANDENLSKNQGPRRKRCGVCTVCQEPSCGKCVHCKDMVKFGGGGKSKQCCINRKCPNLMLAEAEDDIVEDFDELEIDKLTTSTAKKTLKHRTKVQDKNFDWIGEAYIIRQGKKYYKEVKMCNEDVLIAVGDCVMVHPQESGSLPYIARVNHMWEDSKGRKEFHAVWFCRGTDTVLGETSDPKELFLANDCEDSLLATVMNKVEVDWKIIPDDWSMRGGQEEPKPDVAVESRFFYQMWYNPDFARFETIPKDIPAKNEEMAHLHCQSCARIEKSERTYNCILGPRLEESERSLSESNFVNMAYLNKLFNLGDCLYINADVFSFKVKPPVLKVEERRKNVDEDLYPEYYRKISSTVKGSNYDTPQPFRVVRILKIISSGNSGVPLNSDDVKLRVAKFYRPEDTHKGIHGSYQAEYNLLYWSEEEITVKCSDIAGKCNVIFKDNINSPIDIWMNDGPDRFFFEKAYNGAEKSFVEPPVKAKLISGVGKGKGKGKGKSKEKSCSSDQSKLEGHPNLAHKLRSLDVFSGCGGLSEGMHQAGMSDTKWAVEVFEPAAQAFKLNNPDATVFTDDCNLLLKMVMDGEKTNSRGQVLPQKGDVEFLCGGPPCQGFSGMNRFNSRQYSQFKNSLVSSYLSFCDYYRPKYFLLENVRNFVSYKCSMVLKLTLRVLVKLGYQCTFGVLQAGNYGVAQTRRRAIILAAAPGEILPMYPEPLHSFSKRGCNVSVTVDDRRYTNNLKNTYSAPFRTVTVRDTMSDLPEIKNGTKKDQTNYGNEPESHFQRLIRGDQDVPVLRDHICKDMAPIIEARFKHIPTAPGSDWRDLPNIATRLTDGSFSKKLMYTHADKKFGRSSTGALRGVCSCQSGRSCDPMDKQFNTLIPWCLPHTGNRHNNWAGLYGRVEWDGYFSTTITNPEPMGKQGRVLHPEQMRVVSVRECARSQGFPDTYRFYGSLIEKHRQVGNAVPPPLAKAVGMELRRAMAIKDNDLAQQKCTNDEKMDTE